MNQDTAKHLYEISNLYNYLGDRSRSSSFSFGASTIDTLNDLSSTTDLLSLPGIGKSIQEVIKEYIETGSSQRYKDLVVQVPLSLFQDLPFLYNFDREYIKHLWNTFQCSSVFDLKNVPEERAKKALEYYSKPTYSEVPTPNNLLGDGLTQSSLSGGMALGSLVQALKNKNYKHVFMSDNVTSPNQLGIDNVSLFLSQKKKIQELQMNHNIKIWQGCIVDVSEDGIPLVDSQITSNADYIVLTCSTLPHSNQIERLSKAAQTIKDKPIFFYFLDRFSTFLNKNALQSFIDQGLTLLLVSSDDQTNEAIVKTLSTLDLSKAKFMIGSKGTTESKLEDIIYALSLYVDLNLKSPQESLRNMFANPFAESHFVNKVGVRGEYLSTSLVSDKKKFDKIIEAIEEFELKDKSSKKTRGRR